MRRYLPGILFVSLILVTIGYGANVIRLNRQLKRSPVSVTVRTTDPTQGPAGAPVTIVEFGDFQCPACQDFHSVLDQVRQKYGNQVRVVWKDFPVSTDHPDAETAAQAARCAQDQGKFWEMHDQLFQHQDELGKRLFSTYAQSIGLNVPTFERCLNGALGASRVQEDLADGQALGVVSVPTVIVNSLRFSGVPTASEIGQAIDQSLKP